MQKAILSRAFDINRASRSLDLEGLDLNLPGDLYLDAWLEGLKKDESFLTLPLVDGERCQTTLDAQVHQLENIKSRLTLSSIIADGDLDDLSKVEGQVRQYIKEVGEDGWPDGAANDALMFAMYRTMLPVAEMLLPFASDKHGILIGMMQDWEMAGIVRGYLYRVGAREELLRFDSSLRDGIDIS